MPPISAAVFYPLEILFLLQYRRRAEAHGVSLSFRRGSFVLKCPCHRIAGLLEFDQWRKLCWFLLGTYHCRNQLASLLPTNLAKPPQVLVVVNCHSATPLPESVLIELWSPERKKWRWLFWND